MSLRTRLSLAIGILVAVVGLVLSVLHVQRTAVIVFDEVAGRGELSAAQVRDVVIQRVREQAQAFQPRPQTLPEVTAMWCEIVRRDPVLTDVMRRAMANARMVVEIFIAGEDRTILASSEITHVGGRAPRLRAFSDWQRQPVFTRLVEILSEQRDFLISIPLGVVGGDRAVLTVNVLISSVLLRAAIVPALRELVLASALLLAGAVALALLISNLVLRPLAGISQTIDSIAKGKAVDPTPTAPAAAREFADVQSKLGMLGRQVQGARESVTELRQNMAQLMETMEDAALLFGRDERLMVAGAPAERILGRKQAALEGLTIAEIFPSDTPIGAVVQAAVEQQQPIRDRLVVFRQGELERRLLVNVEFGRDPSRRVTLVTLRDAEGRKQLASQLDLSNRLAAINRLTKGVAHEIKNPLNAMALHLEILRNKLDENGEAALPETEIIGKEIARLDRVVKTFLNFTRPVELKLRLADLGEIAGEVVSLQQPQATVRGVTLAFHPDAAGTPVYVDYDVVKQAVLNVVVNGIESMQQGGVLRVWVHRLPGECVLVVSDQGAGIPPEIREKIFDLYFTTKKGGSGIGLAVTFQAVQMHGGVVQFESEPGQGTTFWLRFPAAVSEVSSPQPQRAEA